MNRAVKKYLRQVKRRLYCPHSHKKEFLRRLEDELLLCCEEQNTADYPQLVKQFGEPAAVAEDFITGLDTKAVSRFACTRVRIAYLALAVVIVIALAGTGRNLQNYVQTQRLVTNVHTTQCFTHKNGAECSMFWVRTQYHGSDIYWEYHSCVDMLYLSPKPEWMDDETPYAVDVYTSSNGEVSHWRFGQEHAFWIKIYDT